MTSAMPAGQTVSTRATCTDLRAAYLYATTPHMFQGDTEKAFNAVRDQVRKFLLHEYTTRLLTLHTIAYVHVMCHGYSLLC